MYTACLFVVQHFLLAGQNVLFGQHNIHSCSPSANRTQVFDENTSPLLDTNLDAAGIVCVHADHDEAGGKNDADAGKNTTASAPAPSSATAGSTHSVHGRRLQSTVGDEEDVVCFKVDNCKEVWRFLICVRV